MGYNINCLQQNFLENCCNYFGYCPDLSSNQDLTSKCHYFYQNPRRLLVYVGFPSWGITILCVVVSVIVFCIVRYCIKRYRENQRQQQQRQQQMARNGNLEHTENAIATNMHAQGHGQPIMQPYIVQQPLYPIQQPAFYGQPMQQPNYTQNYSATPYLQNDPNLYPQQYPYYQQPNYYGPNPAGQ